MSGQQWPRGDYITCTCHITEVSRTTFYSNEICDKLKTTQTSKKYSLPSYFGFIQTNTISRVHSCIAKKYSDASHAFIFFFEKTTYCCRTRHLYVRPSVWVCQCLFAVT